MSDKERISLVPDTRALGVMAGFAGVFLGIPFVTLSILNRIPVRGNSAYSRRMSKSIYDVWPYEQPENAKPDNPMTGRPILFHDDVPPDLEMVVEEMVDNTVTEHGIMAGAHVSRDFDPEFGDVVYQIMFDIPNVYGGTHGIDDIIYDIQFIMDKFMRTSFYNDFFIYVREYDDSIWVMIDII